MRGIARIQPSDECHPFPWSETPVVSEKLVQRFYADPKYDGTSAFYAWVRQHVSADMQVLNIGAGPPTRQPVRVLKGEVARVVGADVEPAVLSNGELDEAVLIENGRLPLADATFDLALSDYVLEHVERPDAFLRETARILKPGGSFFFRTPNLFHYVALIARATPHWFHSLVAKKARGLGIEDHEPWRTFYGMNTRGRLRTLAREGGFSSVELRMVEAEPSYLRFHIVPFLAGTMYERTVNASDQLAGLRANIFGRFVK